MVEMFYNYENRGCSGILNKQGDKGPLILLHGYSFTSDIWREIGLLKKLREKSIKFLALDMPYGKISNCKMKSRDTSKNIEYLHETIQREFKESPPIILGASLGGYIALKYGIKYPIKALILVAPVWSNRPEIIDHYSKQKIPILLLYGDEDHIVPKIEMERFKAKTPKTKLIIYEEAPHPLYLKHPSKFAKDITEFIGEIQ